MSPLPTPPRVLLVSAPCLGHINPLVALGPRLASKGLLVTFTTAPHAGLKFRHHQHDDGVLRFEHLRGGEVWAPDDPRYGLHDDLARHLDDVAPAALAGLIRRQADAGRPVTFVVANLFAPWALRAAAVVGVPADMLWTQSCTVLSLYYHYFLSLAALPSKEAGPGAAVVGVPGLPALVAGDLPALIDQVPEEHVWRQILSSEIRGIRETVSCVLDNTFDELEHAAIEALRMHLPILPVGPLFDTENDGNDDDEGTAWLDAQPPRSVVFVAFGSVVMPSRDEMAEVAAC
ncbi:Cinnamate beta-D-glucosyltransferase [Dichanthelium oligosanthes]|uniref:Cinnamate beta-D-glucosyltransferase n=1 Tax=Dichanthelium oligosanthes TaxID=888268 RepID=A0A1E5WIW1_9POAL|nr:Cinnamate beta-D-glucosyltransferase [Dichanthelium oligosanthes]